MRGLQIMFWDTLLEKYVELQYQYFFMISGYFSVGKNSEKIKLTIKKLIVLQIVSDLVYFIFDIIKAIIMNEEIIEVISSYCTIKNILFNLDNVGWYIRALIYIYYFLYY